MGEDKILLSILVPSVHTRRDTHLPKSLNSLYGQWESLPQERQGQVEILYFVDNKTHMLGDKRNKMVDMAQGEYVVFVDDDDRIADTYITDLLEAMWTGPDVITFQVSVSINHQRPKICHYSKDYEKDYNTFRTYHRLPNHICCVKRDLAMRTPFPSELYGEDALYAKLLKPLLRTQVTIDKVLYHYDYSEIGSETQFQITHRKARVREGDEPIADIIILSKGDDARKQKMTQDTVDSMLVGANGLPVRIIVVEQQKGVTYRDAVTYHRTGEFNYNRFMNFGATKGNAPWIMFCNNDLIASDAYLHHLISAGHPVMSPKCPVDGRQKDITKKQTGTTNGRHFSGWCFMMSRELHGKIGGLDESYTFWLSDDVTIEQVKVLGVQPMIVPEAQIRHLGSITLKEQSQEVRDKYCWGDIEDFNRRFGHNKFVDNPNYLAYIKKKHGR